MGAKDIQNAIGPIINRNNVDNPIVTIPYLEPQMFNTV
jgi:hypothetical protein